MYTGSEISINFSISNGTVSYTHLDVYKRQSTKYQGTGGNAVVETAFDKDEQLSDLVVKSVKISYTPDSKGYYRPVYEFVAYANQDTCLLYTSVAKMVPLKP